MKPVNNYGAIGYVRISIKDQSTYSIPYQKKAIIEYCIHNKLNLVNIFVDDGVSSYSFDRPRWLLLESFLKYQKGEIKYLIILDYDRFSRNLPEALIKIDQLDREFDVKVLAINEPLNIDVSAPDTFLNRAFKLLLANNELLKIRERTRRGIRLAMESGRVVNNAPFGYKNKRDEYNSPILEIDPSRASIVTQMYIDFLSRLPDKKIVSDARKRGFTLKGKSALTRVLSNPVYAGLIKVPAFFNMPEKIVHALHSPLISEATYWRAQEILTGRLKHRGSPREEIPLRGLVRCSCGSTLTASFSNGRTKYYLYYRCVREGKPNYPGEVLHGLFDRVLKQLYFTESLKIAIMHAIKEKQEASLSVQMLMISDNKREIMEIDRKVEKLEECLLNDQIEPSSYKKWYYKLKEQKTMLQQRLKSLLNAFLLIQHNLEREVPRLFNAKVVIDNCNFSSRQKFLRNIFEAGLVYDGKVFRAPYIHPAFNYLCNELKEKELFILEHCDAVYSCSGQHLLDEVGEKQSDIEKQFASLIAEIIIESFC